MLKQEIEQKIKEALKMGDVSLLSTLRYLLAAIKNAEIDLHHEVTDEEVIAVIQKQVKQHRESIEAFQKAGRKDLVDKEEYEMQVLEKYLPAQMSEEELKAVVVEVIAELPEIDRRNFGKVMGGVMAKVKGKTDGNTVGKIVKDYLII